MNTIHAEQDQNYVNYFFVDDVNLSYTNCKSVKNLQ